MTGSRLQRHLVAHPCRDADHLHHRTLETRRCGLRALKGGAVDYLLKPFSEEGLLKAVQKALAPE